jgi:type VII secretion integral membrane protein EccD
VTDYTRLSVHGSMRRAEVVVPTDEPVGTVLPRLIELLDEPSGTVARPLTLVGADGEPLDIAQSPQQQGLLDGTALRLVRLDAAPPPPLVIDVTDAAADALSARRDRWGERPRLAVALTAIGIATAAAGSAVPFADAGPLLAAHAGALVVVLATAIGFGLGRMPRLAAVFTAGAAGLALPITFDAARLAVNGGLSSVAPVLAAATALVTLGLVLLLGVGAGLRRRGAVPGGVIGVVLGGILVLQLVLGMPAVDAAAITGTVAAFLTGLLPWVSLSAAGLTGLDQRVGDGEPLPRARAAASIDDAYSALTWGVAATAAALAVSGVVLVLARSLWPALLATAFALVAALRTRAFPLSGQIAILWGVVGVIALTALPALGATYVTAWIAVAAALVLAAVIAAAALVRPRPHQRARLRSLGNVVELVAVVALIPLVLGVFDIYADLLALFGGGA